MKNAPLDLSKRSPARSRADNHCRTHATDFIARGQTLVVKAPETKTTCVSGRLCPPSGRGVPTLAERI